MHLHYLPTLPKLVKYGTQHLPNQELAPPQSANSKAVCSDWEEMFLFQDFKPWIFKGFEENVHKNHERRTFQQQGYKDVSYERSSTSCFLSHLFLLSFEIAMQKHFNM